MKENNQEICPVCKGAKIIVGVCECNMEWRGNNTEDYMDDCQCSPDQECTTCVGRGYLEPVDDP